MNIDRVKYWLSVGAQPTDHVERLLAKAALIPPKPPYPERKKPPTQTKITNWGSMSQDPHQSISGETESSSNTSEDGKVLPSVIAPSGQHIEEEIRQVSEKLVSSVLSESRYNLHTVRPGILDLDHRYVVASDTELRDAFEKLLEQAPADMERVLKTIPKKLWTDDKGSYSFAIRAFMAYIQPGEDISLRTQFLGEWLKRSPKAFRSFKSGNLFAQLNRMFKVWEEVINQLEAKGVWGSAQKGLTEDIRQRARLLKLAEKNPELREKELTAWREIWKNHEKLNLAESGKDVADTALDPQEETKA